MKFTQIQEFYYGKSIFITGVTGFCGKMLLEKLLRSCPGIENIYVLIRPKEERDVQKRLQEVFQEPVFEYLKKDPSIGTNRVFAVEGDISKPGLGLTSEDRTKMCKEVAVVFHAAATIKFHENLKVAMETNFFGTQEMVKLCKEMPNLSALVYVSTAYSYCPLEEIEEKIYPPPANPEKLKEAAIWLTPEESKVIQTSVLGAWPNTYTYSKALAEHVINENCDELPVAIFRPSIVVSTWREPFPGWNDNVNGPTLAILGASLGMIRCGNVGMHKKADFVPVDSVVNALIAAACETGSSPRKKSTDVYNFVSGVQKPITWGQFIFTCKDNAFIYPSSEGKWYMTGVIFLSRFWYLFFSFFLEFIPACLIDLIPTITRGEHTNVDMYLRSRKFKHLVAYFATREWSFRDDNVRALFKSLSPADRAVFNFDLSELDWNKYLLNYMLGLRTFVLNEDPSTLPASRKRYRMLYLIHLATSMIVLYLIYVFFRITGYYVWILVSCIWDLLFSVS